MGGELHPTRDRDEPTTAWEPPTDSHVEPGFDDGDVEIPQMPTGGPTGPLTRRNLVFGVLFITAALVGLYFLVPKFAGLNQTWGQLERGNPLWLAVAAGFELLSICGYAVLFRTVFARGVSRLGWRASIEIPLAGIAAIRLLAAAGAGGVAVTVWALRRAGMQPRVIACRLAANYSIQYSLYLLAMVVCGFGLWSGAFSGGGPTALTLIPAILSAVALVLGAAMGLVPGDFERRLEHLSRRSGRIGRLATRFATLPATLGSGVRTALGLIRDRHWGLLGAVAYWGVRHRMPRRVVPGVRHGRAGRGARDGVLPRHAREPAAAAGRDRRRRGRDDRRVRGVRRARRACRDRGARLPRDLVLAADAPGHRGLRHAALYGSRMAGRGHRGAARWANAARRWGRSPTARRPGR